MEIVGPGWSHLIGPHLHPDETAEEAQSQAPTAFLPSFQPCPSQAMLELSSQSLPFFFPTQVQGILRTEQKSIDGQCLLRSFSE